MTHVMRQRLKLVALLGLLSAPLPLAWAMLSAQVGIPEGRVANGALLPKVKPLTDWSLDYLVTENATDNVTENATGNATDSAVGAKEAPGMPPLAARGADEQRFWLSWPEPNQPQLAAAQAERWWRLHRALGKEAPRLGRLVVAEKAFVHPQVPGEQRALGHWPSPNDATSAPHQLRLIDPHGQVVVAYGPEITPQAVMKDVRRLLKRNPVAPR
ncbi:MULTISPECIES: hypothetical protein [Cobetia]|uniref:hypothetical protein n=1 Tax=Cobetia TaxID=204286 RepID=UPI0015833112|nr:MULTISPECIES: hypothetical protein [Cobetia]MDI4660588.1 hypothetical protein [Cobetia sp. BMC6]NUJ54778.1 hypothetical protein [Cobetia marina]